jgi:hypothetical protein
MAWESGLCFPMEDVSLFKSRVDGKGRGRECIEVGLYV